MSDARSDVMTMRLLVCHAHSEIEATSETVDALEQALEFPEGVLWASSLPGYALDSDADALRDALGSTRVVIALASAASARDPQVNFELGAAWLLGIRTVLLWDDAETARSYQLALPAPLRDAPQIYGLQGKKWAELIGDLSLRLGLMPRNAVPHVGVPQPTAAYGLPPSAADTDTAASTQALVAELARVEKERESNTRPMQLLIDEAVPSVPVPVPVPVPVVELELQAQSLDREPENTAELRVPELESEPVYTSDVFARLPTCERALEAGRAVSECVFNRDEIQDFAHELDAPLGILLAGLGEDWDALKSEQDLDVWVERTDDLLQSLPSEASKIDDWYRLGFELAILHNLAGQLSLDGTDLAAEQRWRAALERFLMRAEKAEIGYENLGRVLALLENLAGPTDERDFANIGRSLDELRQYAAGADEIHTAA